MRKTWGMLFPGEKEVYIKKAVFLLGRGYVLDLTAEQLAKRTYEAEEVVDTFQ
jgi:hypothetical protein